MLAKQGKSKSNVKKTPTLLAVVQKQPTLQQPIFLVDLSTTYHLFRSNPSERNLTLNLILPTRAAVAFRTQEKVFNALCSLSPRTSKIQTVQNLSSFLNKAAWQCARPARSTPIPVVRILFYFLLPPALKKANWAGFCGPNVQAVHKVYVSLQGLGTCFGLALVLARSAPLLAP